ncbi:MAG TPA: GNAT family N-acetyltransferase, partial [Tahibacter sp.]|nr:GNAT family N-acetyltransferase [Tahibacter sp.]
MLKIENYTGAAVAPHLDAVAALRIGVFRDWPYLYDGDADYEARYLATYTRSPRSLFVLVFDGDAVVGASTALPLADETDAFRQPFEARGLDVGGVFYFGESVLLPA